MTPVFQQLFLQAEDIPSLPRGWRPAQVKEVSELLNPGKVYDEQSVSDTGQIPVVNQASDGWHGFHDEEPGVVASEDLPVSTFANHTCAMRLLRQSFSCIQNIFPRIGKLGVCDTVFFHYATLGRVPQSGYKGHHPIYRDAWIPLPPLPTQIDIGRTISAYDDLIENNRRRMAMVEEAARQLYHEWFIRLRFPGHEYTPVTKGVPEGWERRPLDGCVKFRSGGTPSKQRSEYWEGDIPWVSSGEMTETRLYDMPLHVSQEGAEEGSTLVPAGTILVVVRGMSLAKECRLSVVTRDMTFNQDLKALVCKPDVDSEFLFHSLLAMREYIRDLATEASHGTKKLDTAVLERLPILVPQPRLQRRFRESLDSLNAHRDNLHWQNEKLRAARDLLLPRLMSGEIAV